MVSQKQRLDSIVYYKKRDGREREIGKEREREQPDFSVKINQAFVSLIQCMYKITKTQTTVILNSKVVMKVIKFLPPLSAAPRS